MDLRGYEEECAAVFLKEQEKLLGAVAVETADEALEMLDDACACVLDNAAEVKDYLDESGIDVSGMSDEEVLDSLEVFKLPSGKFMVVIA